MIELKNVSKIYKPSKGVTIKALSNINLSFKEKGFVVLTGESGSGKTTLLNILAGLDNYTQGDMLIDNISTKKIKETAWDEYRNKRVGIVFQNYSLLEEFSVKKNVSLALELQRIDDKKEWVEWALDKVNMYDYTNKRVNKLSGGQKQRVAIARAIVKDPQIILADEPTGNLDTKNSEEIFELLKDLSKEHLVVVITHNVELANKYADRIIRLVDGEIVEDEKFTKEILEEPSKEKSLSPKGLKLMSILRLGISSMLKQWFRLFATILMLIVMLTSIGVALGVSRYNKKDVIAKTIINEGGEFIAIKKVGKDSLFTENDEAYLKRNECSYIKVVNNDNYINLTKFALYTEINNEVRSTTISPLLMKKNFSLQPHGFVAVEDLMESGVDYKLNAGRWPKNSFEVCITRYSASVIIADKKALYVNSNNEYKEITINDMLGAKMYLNSGSFYVTIVGIVDTGLKEKYYLDEKDNYKELFEELKGIHNVIFAKKNLIEKGLTFNNNLSIEVNKLITTGSATYSLPTITSVYPYSFVESFEDFDCEYIYGDNILDEFEILANKEFMIAQMNVKEGEIRYSKETENIDEIIRQTIENGFDISTTLYKTVNAEREAIIFKQFRVVGLIDSDKPIISAIYCHDEKDEMSINSKTYLIELKECNVEDIITLSNDYALTTSKIYDINVVSNRANQIKVLGIVLGILFGILAVITIIDFTQSTIKDNYRHIGILRALGTTRIDVYKIYIIETMVLALVAIILAMFILNPIINYFDQSSGAKEVLGISLFETRLFDYIIMSIVGITITFSSAITIIFISLKKSIIELIYRK